MHVQRLDFLQMKHKSQLKSARRRYSRSETNPRSALSVSVAVSTRIGVSQSDCSCAILKIMSNLNESSKEPYTQRSER